MMPQYRCMYETFEDVAASSEEEAEKKFRAFLIEQAQNKEEPLGCICWLTDDPMEY